MRASPNAPVTFLRGRKSRKALVNRQISSIMEIAESERYGKSPAMTSLKVLKEFNALPDPERIGASARFIDERIARGDEGYEC